MRLGILIFIIFISPHGFSQEISGCDSLYFFKISERQLAASKRNATNLLHYPLNQASKVSVHYLHEDGTLKGPQMPESSTIVSFEAEGIKRLDRFKLFGTFQYAKIWEGKLGNTLRGSIGDDHPFYHFAAKTSDFSRQKYDAEGIISYEILNRKLYFSTGFNYVYYLASRSIDPRMSIDWFDFQMQPELTYVLKNWNLGIGGMWGYGVENTDIKYKRREYGTGLQYPDRITYLNYGFGYAPISTDNFSRRKEYKGASINLNGSSGGWNILMDLAYKSSSDENRKALEQSVNNSVFSTYTSETISGYALITRTRGQNTKQIELSYSNLAGEDFVNSLLGKNYTALNVRSSAAFYNANMFGNNTLEWGISLDYLRAYKRDAVTDHVLDYSFIQPGISGSWYRTTSLKNRYALTLAPALHLPFEVYASAPSTQHNAFTLTVMYPEYIYRQIRTGVVNLKLDYINSTLSKTFKTGVTLNTVYSKALSVPKVDVPASLVPGNHRLSANLSLNLYF